MTEAVRVSLKDLIAALDAEIERIQARIDDLFGNHPNLRRDRDLLYAGLSPAHRQSGVGAKRTHLSKAGNAYLRKALYFPAIVAMRYNPPLRAMADRLASRGKPKMVIVGALMRKLITIAYAVLKSGQPFDAVLAAART